MAEDAEDKLIAVARHIARTLGRSETMTDDILKTFSSFDGRFFSREKLWDPPPGDGEIRDSPPLPPADRAFRALERQVSRFVSMDRHVWSDSCEASAFLESVDDLLSEIRRLESPRLGGRAEDLLQQSMIRLEEEFRALMQQAHGALPAVRAAGSSGTALFDSDEEGGGYSDEDDDEIPVAQPVQDYNIVVDALTPGTVADLNEIARRMVAAGFGKECADAYAASRRDFLEESVARLGLRQRIISSSDSEEAPWSVMEEEIPRWTRGVDVAFRILFPSERRLCDRVFAGLHPAADIAFVEACRGTAIQLLGFADAVAVGNRAPERLFRVVDMYETLGSVLPELASVFADNYSSIIRSEAASVWRGLGAAIRGIFMELENLIRRDPAKVPVPGGGIHPITRYVMNYLRAACASRRSLERATGDESTLSVQVAWIMEVLQANLEAKSKVYKNTALSCIFLINNGRYISQKAKGGELVVLLGEEWVRREAARLRRWHGEYQRASWGKVAAALHPGGGGGEAPEGLRTMRERARVFEICLVEVCREQRDWVAADDKLMGELRAAAVAAVIPEYRSFVGRLRTAEGGVKHAGRSGGGGGAKQYYCASVETVEGMINDLFGRR